MRDAERQTRSHLIALFQRQGLHPRGDLGQNFLIDLNLIELVVREAELSPVDVVLEVGAGTGSLTSYLGAVAGHVVSVEYDPNMYVFASDATSHYENVTLLNCDALKNKNHLAPAVLEALDAALAKVHAATGADPVVKLVANLPYHVGTPVISNLISTGLPWGRMVVTVQWELAVRMAAKPGTSDYSALTVWLQSQADIKTIRKLPPSVFWPRPNVDSAIVRIDPAPDRQARIVDREFLHTFLRETFTQRRKRLAGVVAGMNRDRWSRAEIDAMVAAAGIPLEARAEQLEVAQLVELANRLAVSGGITAPVAEPDGAEEQ
jgi:16S rRNA (adenine1518-N6/adenine1519-N6)-dimethyltransferase